MRNLTNKKELPLDKILPFKFRWQKSLRYYKAAKNSFWTVENTFF